MPPRRQQQRWHKVTFVAKQRGRECHFGKKCTRVDCKFYHPAEYGGAVGRAQKRQEYIEAAQAATLKPAVISTAPKNTAHVVSTRMVTIGGTPVPPLSPMANSQHVQSTLSVLGLSETQNPPRTTSPQENGSLIGTVPTMTSFRPYTQNPPIWPNTLPLTPSIWALSSAAAANNSQHFWPHAPTFSQQQKQPINPSV
jgi:hypothetical protein